MIFRSSLIFICVLLFQCASHALVGEFVSSIPAQACVVDYERNVCSGVVVGQRWILSAAHCRANKGTPKIKCRGSARPIHALSQILHPKYEPVNGTNRKGKPLHDIMLIRLKENVGIPGVSLASNQDEVLERIGRRSCYIYGAGERFGGDAGKLRGIISPHDVTYMLPTKILFVESPKGYGVREGDSGAPLICIMNDGRIQLAGITAFRTSIPGGSGFTFIPDKVNLNWILQTLSFH